MKRIRKFWASGLFSIPIFKSTSSLGSKHIKFGPISLSFLLSTKLPIWSRLWFRKDRAINNKNLPFSDFIYRFICLFIYRLIHSHDLLIKITDWKVTFFAIHAVKLFSLRSWESKTSGLLVFHSPFVGPKTFQQ